MSVYLEISDNSEHTECTEKRNGVVKMAEKKENGFGCMPNNCCCKIESVISIDERGQLVLPKEIREKAKIRGGDKFAVISWVKGDAVCCISLLKTEEFTKTIKDIFGPMMKEMVKE